MAVNEAIADETGKDAQGQLTTHCCLPAGGICSKATDRCLLIAAGREVRLYAKNKESIWAAIA